MPLQEKQVRGKSPKTYEKLPPTQRSTFTRRSATNRTSYITNINCNWISRNMDSSKLYVMALLDNVLHIALKYSYERDPVYSD